MDDFNHFLKDLSTDRRNIKIKEFCLEFLEFQPINKYQEEVLNKVLFTDGNILLLQSRQIGISSIFRALSYAYNKIGLKSEHYIPHHRPYIEPNNSDILFIDGLSYFLNDSNNIEKIINEKCRIISSSFADENIRDMFFKRTNTPFKFDECFRLRNININTEWEGIMGETAYRKEYSLLFKGEKL